MPSLGIGLLLLTVGGQAREARRRTRKARKARSRMPPCPPLGVLRGGMRPDCVTGSGGGRPDQERKVGQVYLDGVLPPSI